MKTEISIRNKKYLAHSFNERIVTVLLSFF